MINALALARPIVTSDFPFSLKHAAFYIVVTLVPLIGSFTGMSSHSISSSLVKTGHQEE